MLGISLHIQKKQGLRQKIRQPMLMSRLLYLHSKALFNRLGDLKEITREI